MKPLPTKRLTIHYKPNLAIVPRTESFKTSDPDRIISRRNAPNIERVFYDGKPFDIKKHQKMYANYIELSEKPTPKNDSTQKKTN